MSDDKLENLRDSLRMATPQNRAINVVLDTICRNLDWTITEIERLTAELAKVKAIIECCAAECEPDDSLEVNERVAVLRAERDELRNAVRLDYSQYEPHHPYAVELRDRYPWLVAEAAKEKTP